VVESVEHGWPSSVRWADAMGSTARTSRVRVSVRVSVQALTALLLDVVFLVAAKPRWSAPPPPRELHRV